MSGIETEQIVVKKTQKNIAIGLTNVLSGIYFITTNSREAGICLNSRAYFLFIPFDQPIVYTNLLAPF